MTTTKSCLHVTNWPHAKGHTKILVLIFAAALAGCSGKEADSGTSKGRQKMAPPVPVVVASVAQRTIPEQIHAIGNIEAYATVQIKSRVDGEITRVHFNEGDTVRAGQPLFTIDPRPFQAQVDQAKANLARDNAQLENAQAQERRYKDLLAQHFVSREMFAQIHTTEVSAAAVVQADEAALENARLQLAYSSIRSPIDGVTGNLQLKMGNLVKANDTVSLVVINQITPIYVTFSVPEHFLPRIRQLMAKKPAIVVEATPTRSLQHAEQGQLTFVDNAVDTTTGTIKMKGTFNNTNRTLWPGQFADVTITLAQQNALVVPNQAVQTGPAGSFVYVINPDMKAEQRKVSPDHTYAGETVIQSGLQAGEKIVIDGQLRLTPGAKVVLRPAP